MTTKLGKKTQPQKPKNRASLDTLGVLVTTDDLGRGKMIKRQKAKAITLAQLYLLIDLDSEFKKKYRNAYHCNNFIIQYGYEFKTRYCGYRWCNVCQRISMAKMIKGYSIPLSDLIDLQFITLTRKNVKAFQLREEYEDFMYIWDKINRNLKKTYGVRLEGIRKVECTYNPRTDEYNLHFHFLIDGIDNANLIVEYWLKHNPDASPSGQDIRKADSGSLLELFKYAAKGIYKGKFYAHALDNIYQLFYDKKAFQPLGIRKYVDEDISGIKSQEIKFKGYRSELWTWDKDRKDWVNKEGELLTGYIIKGKMADIIESLAQSDKEEEKIEQLDIEFEEIKIEKSDSYNMAMYSDCHDIS